MKINDIKAFNRFYTVSQKTDFQNICAAGKRIKFAIKPYLPTSTYACNYTTLGIKNSNFCRYLADMERNANKLHFNSL